MNQLEETIVQQHNEIVGLRQELVRLKRGEFTMEEFQNLCHNRHEKPGCTAKEFFDGCAAFQKSMFGHSERGDKAKENDLLRSNCEGFKKLLARLLEAETKTPSK